MEPLNVVAAIVAQQVEGALILDTFGHYLQPEVVPEIDRGANDRGAVPVRRHVQDEGLVDLDLLHRKAFQVGQRGVAGAKVIDRDADARLVQAPQRLLRLGRDDRPLGDLEAELVGCHLPGAQQLGDGVGKLVVEEVPGGEVHRHADVDAGPGPRVNLAEGLVEHPGRQRLDEVGLLG